MTNCHRIPRCLSLFVAGLATLAAWPDAGMAADPASPDTVVVVGRWVPRIESGVTLTQGSYSKNWSGGDQGSLVWSFITNASLNNQLNQRMNWRNTLKLAFGQTHQQKLDPATQQRHWDRPEKSTDLLDFETVMRFTLGGFVDPFVSGHFQSRFQDASDPSGRNLTLNPLQFSEAAGIARQFINQADQTLISRVGLSVSENSRKTFTYAAPDTRTTTESTHDAGIQWVTEAQSKLLQKRVSWSSKLIVNQPVEYSGKSTMKDALANMTPDELQAAGIERKAWKYSVTAGADWENIFTSQITKLISVNLYTRWIYMKYDNTVKPLQGSDGKLANPDAVRAAIRKAGQFKETLALGFTYRFL